MLGINSTQISALKTNPGSTPWNFERGSHGVGPSGYPEGPHGGLQWTWWKVRHVGYQFYSDFSKKSKSRVNTPKFWTGLPWGWPIGVPRGPPRSFPVNLMKVRYVGYQFYSDFSKKNKSRVNTPKFWTGLPCGGQLGSPFDTGLSHIILSTISTLTRRGGVATTHPGIVPQLPKFPLGRSKHCGTPTTISTTLSRLPARQTVNPICHFPSTPFITRNKNTAD